MKDELMAKLQSQQFIEPEMVKTAFNFWFTDRQHLRSPFPQYIRSDLQNKATNQFLDWAGKISDKAKKEINDEILAEKFEEIIFETALKLAGTEDEKLTIRYPFMPRMGDAINEMEGEISKGESHIIGRSYHKKGDRAFLNVRLKNTVTDKEWETEFELPE